MLTPEEKQRIEEDERKRHAEEQYRAQIRSQLQQPAAASSPAQPSGAKPRSFLKILAGVAACAVAVVIISNLASNSASNATASGGASPLFAPQARYVPMTTNIASGQVVVHHGSAVNYRITITPDMREPVVSGTFTAAGGHGNDIAAVLADESGYTNWINGHQAQVFWSTQGKETTGSFEVRLKPGTYYLALSNRFSAFTDKYVVLEANLKYQQLQTN
jgi:hypothetical protein